MRPPPTSQAAALPKLPATATRARRPGACGWRAFAFVCLLCLCLPRAEGALDLDVQINGVGGELLANVRAYLTVEQQRADPALNESRLRRYHQKAPEEIATALHPFGYYQAQITSSLDHVDGRWIARYEIKLGEPVLVKDVNVSLIGEGNNDPELRRLIDEFPLHSGDILDQRLYTRGKDGFQRVANERGYFEFKFLTHAIVIDTVANTALIELGMNSGPRYKFGDVTYYQDVLRQDFLTRFAHFKPGDPYEIRKLLDLQSALFDSDYFNNVEITPQRDETHDLEVPIDVSLTPRPKYRYTTGLGYGTDTGTRGRLGFENRRVNDRGHRFRAEYQLSEVRESLTTNYSLPIRNPRTDEIALTTSWVDDYPEVSQSEIFSVALSRTYARRSNWLESVYLKYQTERYSVATDVGNAVLLMPGASWTKISADTRTYPSRGLRFLIDVRGAHPTLLSDRQFVQIRTQIKTVTTLAHQHRVILRGEVGNTRLQSIRSLPTSVRFFAGGSQSVRGYDFNSLGPRNELGQVVGGSRLLVGSAEYEYRFTDAWSGALFFDTGNALNSWQDALKQGAGFGVRWISPVGPVRIDLAWAVSEPGTPMRLHLNVGPDL